MSTLKQHLFAAALACLLASVSLSMQAAQFRAFAPIAVPEAAPAGYRESEALKPLSRALIMRAMQRLFDAWSGVELGRYLAESFYDKDRLVDAIAQDVPRDARLRVLSIQSSQPLAQFVSKARQGDALLRTRVAVIARVQLEWNDASAGFQRLEGTTEYVLEITTRAGTGAGRARP